MKRKDLTIELKRAAVALMVPGLKVSALARELGVCRQRLYELREAAGRSSSGQHCPLDGLWQCDEAEEHFWIEVIIPGLVNDPQQAVLLRNGVPKHDINLPLLERGGIVLVADAHRQLF